MTEREKKPATSSKKRRRTRTSDTGIKFSDGYASEWAFGVPQEFRDALDIKYLSYKAKGVSAETWTRGQPPVLSFTEGHVFYQPRECRDLLWDNALKRLEKSVLIRDAAPDKEDGTEGWVEFELRIYRAGKVAKSESLRSSQAAFEVFLRSGVLPPKI